jgi:hypothetical protein
MLDYFGVEDAIPLASEPDALLLACSNEIAVRAVQRLVPRLEAALGAAEGRGVAVRVVPMPAAGRLAPGSTPATDRDETPETDVRAPRGPA